MSKSISLFSLLVNSREIKREETKKDFKIKAVKKRKYDLKKGDKK